MMQCKDVYQFICDNLDQAIDSPECKAIRQHIEQCADCKAYLSSLKATVSLYRSEPVPGMSPSVHRRLMSVLNQITEHPHGPHAEDVAHRTVNRTRRCR